MALQSSHWFDPGALGESHWFDPGALGLAPEDIVAFTVELEQSFATGNPDFIELAALRIVRLDLEPEELGDLFIALEDRRQIPEDVQLELSDRVNALLTQQPQPTPGAPGVPVKDPAQQGASVAIAAVAGIGLAVLLLYALKD